jgi:hypothetical protein
VVNRAELRLKNVPTLDDCVEAGGPNLLKGIYSFTISSDWSSKSPLTTDVNYSLKPNEPEKIGFTIGPSQMAAAFPDINLYNFDLLLYYDGSSQPPSSGNGFSGKPH